MMIRIASGETPLAPEWCEAVLALSETARVLVCPECSHADISSDSLVVVGPEGLVREYVFSEAKRLARGRTVYDPLHGRDCLPSYDSEECGYCTTRGGPRDFVGVDYLAERWSASRFSRGSLASKSWS
jgi:hypothetical protein